MAKNAPKMGGFLPIQRFSLSLMEVTESSSEVVERKAVSAQLVLPGEIVTDDPTAMRGHGTYLLDGQIIASVAGVVERIGKLVSVKPLRSRYIGETGDVVIGRVVEVASNRWKLDVNSRQHANLQIGAVSLHGGVHRRRTVDDTLQMRSYFVEHDLLVADVQSVHTDGTLSLHVPKSYHKLDNGVFVAVPPSLIRRVKTHFCTLPCGVDVILGNNGFIWISPALTEEEIELRAVEDSTWTPTPISKDLRLALSRVRNAIAILAQLFHPIFPETIMHIFNNSLPFNVADLLKPDLISTVSQGLETIQTTNL